MVIAIGFSRVLPPAITTNYFWINVHFFVKILRWKDAVAALRLPILGHDL